VPVVALLLSATSFLELEVDSASINRVDLVCSLGGLYFLIVEHPTGSMGKAFIEPDPACISRKFIIPGGSPGVSYFMYFLLDPSPKTYSFTMAAEKKGIWRISSLRDPDPIVLSSDRPDIFVLTQKLSYEDMAVLMVLSKRGSVRVEVLDPSGETVADGEGEFLLMPIPSHINGAYYYWIETGGANLTWPIFNPL